MFILFLFFNHSTNSFLRKYIKEKENDETNMLNTYINKNKREKETKWGNNLLILMKQFCINKLGII